MEDPHLRELRRRGTAIPQCDESTSRPPFHWRNQGLIPPMQRGGSIGRSQEAAFTMSDEPANANPAFSLAESGPDSANGKGVFPLAGRKKLHLPRPMSLPMETPPFSLAESGPDSANGKGVFPLAGRNKLHLPCRMSLPMETPPFSLAESGPDSANGKGGVSIGR